MIALRAFIIYGIVWLARACPTEQPEQGRLYLILLVDAARG
jgi:hypothetical protein